MDFSLLLVDDDRELLRLMERYLHEDYPNWKTSIAISARDALTRFEEEEFDIIICDYYLGPDEMSGLEILEKLRNTNNEIPLIIFTGKSQEEVAIRALNLGADFYLRKGIEDFETSFKELMRITTQKVEAKKAREALIQSEEIFRAIFEKAPIGIATISHTNEIMKINDTLFNLLGYAKTEELLGMNWLDITHANYIEKEKELNEKLLMGVCNQYKVEKQIHRKNGQIIWVEQRTSIVLNQWGEPIFNIVMLIDISHRMENE